ncbi:MAG TPA: PrgI family protein [Candidatus Paceibacterota bacterium]|nr:PrgI family protein [Candidatus Paceibacterota bacterium]
MQFQVPQFIEIEDTIFGPLTFKQFVYVAGGVGIAAVTWRLLPLLIAAPIMGGAVALGVALAFVKVNDRPLIDMLEHAFYYFIGAKLYLWDNRRRVKDAPAENIQAQIKADRALGLPALSESKLHELAWSLDIKEKMRGAEAGSNDFAQ